MENFQKDFLWNKSKWVLNSNLELIKSQKNVMSWRREGRNAIFFAKMGFNVTAIDASNLGLKNLKIGQLKKI